MQWTQDKIQQLPQDDGFYLRGDSMTRIETFVAAAFAFTLTLTVISSNEIPTNIPETIAAIKNIPAFLMCTTQIVWIWYEHALWSKRYGLEDAMTAFWSAILLMLVLIYIYPLKMMTAGFFAWISDGYFKAGFHLESYNDLRFIFSFNAIGFGLLGALFWQLYQSALRKRSQLLLTTTEIHHTQTQGYMWLIILITNIIVLFLTLILPNNALPFAPMLYATFGFSITYLHIKRSKNIPPNR